MEPMVDFPCGIQGIKPRALFWPLKQRWGQRGDGEQGDGARGGGGRPAVSGSLRPSLLHQTIRIKANYFSYFPSQDER